MAASTTRSTTNVTGTRGTHRRRLAVLLVVIAAIAADDRAHAAGTEGTPAEAGVEDLLNRGIALRRAGNDEAALPVFLELEKRAPSSVRVLLHITTAAQATGKWMMAYEYLQKASTHRDDPYYERHKAAIENVERTITQRVGQFRASGSPVGAEVRLSGEVVGTLPMLSVRAIEAGSYLLEVSKPGYFSLRRPITVIGGGNLTQEAVELFPQNPFMSAPMTGQPLLQPMGDSGVQPKAPPWWQARWVTWSFAGAAVVAAGASVAAFTIREQDAAHWNDNSRCLDGSNTSRTRQDVCGGIRRDLKLAEGIGIGTGIAAVAFAGAAIGHWLLTPHDHPSETSAGERGRPSCTPGLGGVVCDGSF